MAELFTETKETKQLGTGEPLTRRSRAYLLEFRYKNRLAIPGGHTKQKVFWFDGRRKEAVERARLHCERMNYQYIFCSPYIVDLENQEEQYEKYEQDDAAMAENE